MLYWLCCRCCCCCCCAARWYEGIIAASDDLATIMTLEGGKPLAEAKAEIAAGWAPHPCAVLSRQMSSCLSTAHLGVQLVRACLLIG